MTVNTSQMIDRLFRRDPALLENPLPAFRELRDAGPILHTDGPPGGPPWLNAWHCFAYDDVASGLRDARLSSRRQMASMPLEHFGIDPTTPAARFFWTMQAETMLTMDAPDHTRLRRLSLRAFTPRVVEGLRDGIRATVDDLLDRTVEEGGDGFDLMSDLAAPLPAMVIARLLGIPPDDWQMFKGWSDGLIGFNITQQEIDNFFQLGEYLRAAIADRRATPRDDLISGLIAARDQDDALSEDELIGQCVILLIGGHETTTYAIGNAAHRLLADRGLWGEFPGVSIEGAIEELLRFDSPFQALARKALEDIDLNGHQVRAGDTVWLWIAAANHDPSQFPDPERLDLNRGENRHLSFGIGPHYCLGAPLARIELQIAVRTVRERFPTLQLASDTVEWKRDGAIRGPRTLPVAWS
jgi:pimeloyl-[acyl-carrier protein] synthase